jgi:NitT/TauT family transport system ATP-binding protein
MLSDRIVMSARPGRILDIVKTAWPRERDSRILEDARFGAVSAHLWHLLRDETIKAADAR